MNMKYILITKDHESLCKYKDSRLKSISESYHDLSKGNEPVLLRYEEHGTIWLRANQNEMEKFTL